MHCKTLAKGYLTMFDTIASLDKVFGQSIFEVLISTVVPLNCIIFEDTSSIRAYEQCMVLMPRFSNLLICKYRAFVSNTPNSPLVPILFPLWATSKDKPQFGSFSRQLNVSFTSNFLCLELYFYNLMFFHMYFNVFLSIMIFYN